MKKCALCKQEKPFEAFAIAKKAKTGRHPYCKECASEKMRAAYKLRGKQSWMNDKICRWCNTLKPRADFPRTLAGKIGPRCNSCVEDVRVHESNGERRCNICREWLPEDRFYPSKLKFPHIACQDCTRAQMTQPDYKVRRREFMLMKEYGITGEQYDELVAKQGGSCPICLKPLPPNRGGYVDHVHGGEHKGKIRAILHGICNRFVMWEHEDSGQLRRAADLIDNPLTDWVVPGKPSSEIRKQARKREKEKPKK